MLGDWCIVCWSQIGGSPSDWKSFEELRLVGTSSDGSSSDSLVRGDSLGEEEVFDGGWKGEPLLPRVALPESLVEAGSNACAVA